MKRNRVFQNAKWIMACKIAQSLLQLVVGMLSARYLGPSNFGLINYASSVVAFAVPIMQLGMSETLVQEYVTKPEREGEILGTSLAMNLPASLACIVGVVSFVMAANPNEKITIIVSALYSLSLIFQSLEMVKYWFQAKLLSKYSSLAMLFSYVVVSAYKIYLLVSQKSVYWFALIHSVEYCTTGILLLVAYRKNGTQKLRVSWKTAKELFSKSRYYIVSALMVVIYNSAGNVMLKLIVGEAENGFYATATTCMVIVGFVYAAIMDSAQPVILESKQLSQEGFEKNVVRLYSIIFYLSLAQSICFTLLAKPIVWILYGEAYLPSAPVLRIIVWQTIFAYTGTVRDMWILGEGKYNILWRINMAGAVVNVTLNSFLIPLWGACGAAAASLSARVVTTVVVGFFMKTLRPSNRLMLRSLDPRNALEALQKLKR